MGEYKMNQYDLQRYFKSLCNSFYIAYEQVRRSEKEYYREDEELGQTFDYWLNNMQEDFEALKSVLYTIKDNDFSIIVTTKAEIYALIKFYYTHTVKSYPIINMEEEYIQAFPRIEELSDDFIIAYKKALDENEKAYLMEVLFDKYF